MTEGSTSTASAEPSRTLSVADVSDEDDLPMAGWQRRRRARIWIAVVLGVLLLGGGLAALLLRDRGNVSTQEPAQAVGQPAPATTPPSLAVNAPPATLPPLLSPPPSPPPAPTAPAIAPKTAIAPKSFKTPKTPKPRSIKQVLAAAKRLRESNPRKALKLYDEALGDGPNAAAHAGKGWTYLGLREYSLSAREFHIAVRMGKGGANYIGLGTAYRRLNQRDNARAQFKKYLQLYPDGEEASVARTNLQSLE